MLGRKQNISNAQWLDAVKDILVGKIMDYEVVI